MARSFPSVVVCAGLVLGSALVAQGQDATAQADAQALAAQVSALSAEVSQLRDQLGQNWLSERRARKVKVLVKEVLADADTRASLAGGGVTAGYNGGFFIGDDEGNFMLKIAGVVKPRYVFNHQDNPPADPAGDSDEDRGGFEITSARLAFSGHVVDPSWQYLLIYKFTNTDNLDLLEAFITKHNVIEGLDITVGQFKIPLLLEDLVSEVKQQMVDRSLIAGTLAGSYTQGVMLTYTTEPLRLFASFNDGLRRINTSWDTTDTDFGLSARAELKLAGDWK